MNKNKIIPIEYKEQRILTTKQLAESYETEPRRISENFNNNRGRYIEGKHYYCLKDEEKREFLNHTEISDGLKNAETIYLWTEKGALLHAKSLNTDVAWAVYDSLVENYFNIKEKEKVDIAQLSPQMQLFNLMFKAVAENELKLTQQEEKIIKLEAKTDEVQQTITDIQNTFIERDEDWRNSLNLIFNDIVEKSDSKDFQKARNYTYKILEERAHCNLSIRVNNLKTRLENNGATKTTINNANKLDTIESDPKLKEIYTNIVKELAIRYSIKSFNSKAN